MHCYDYNVYSTKYKRIYFQTVEYNDRVVFKNHSSNRIYDEHIKKYLRDISNWTNEVDSKKFGLKK